MQFNIQKSNNPIKKMDRRSKQKFVQRRHIDEQKAYEKMLNITNHQRNTNQNQNEVSPHTSQNGHHQKNLQTRNAGKGVEKRKHSHTVGGNVNWYSHYGEQYGGFLKTLKENYHVTQQSHSWGIYLEKTIIQKDTCTPMFTEALFTTAKTCKYKCLFMEEQIKIWYIYTMEYYSTIKKNKIMLLVAIRMDLEIVHTR